MSTDSKEKHTGDAKNSQGEEKRGPQRENGREEKYRSAYRRVLSVCSTELTFGEMLAIIMVRELPTKESLSTCVNVEPRNG